MSAPTEHEHHVVGPKVYLLILLALLVLTATTTGVAYIDMGIFNPIIALAIGEIQPGRQPFEKAPAQYRNGKMRRLQLVAGQSYVLV